MSSTGSTSEAAEFWDGFYDERDQVWSGRPNAILEQDAAGLTPGTALDVGCGEGGDAVWLARHGWTVTAIDVAEEALRRGAAHAAAEGLGDRIRWERHDLAASFPAGEFDLVTSHYLHSTVGLPREAVLRRAAAAVAPGGTLLVVGHAVFPPWAHQHEHDHDQDHGDEHGDERAAVHLPTPDEVLRELDLAPGDWTVERVGLVEREMVGPAGELGTLSDAVVRVHRAG